MRQMGPIFAAALLSLGLWEVITSGFRWLPLPYFPSPAGVFQSLINDRALLFDSTWHSLILLLSGYALGVIAGLISGICIGWSSPVRYWGMPILKIVGPIPATAWIPLAMVSRLPHFFPPRLDRARRLVSGHDADCVRHFEYARFVSGCGAHPGRGSAFPDFPGRDSGGAARAFSSDCSWDSARLS